MAGKRQNPVGAGRPAGEELSSIEPVRECSQVIALTSTALYNPKRKCKPGLLVVEATVKGFAKPWKVLIDSGASGNYARRSTMEDSQQYAEALSARNHDHVTVRLATGTRVTVPKVPVNLGVKFLDFDSVERCLVLDLDARYDLILGMAWLERHEPWIDWRSKTLGATRLPPDGALASHEPTSARKQKRYWREHWTESVNVLEIGMSELLDTEGVLDASPEHCSQTKRGVAREPLSDTRCDNEETLHVKEDMIGSKPRHLGPGPNDACGVTLYSPSDARSDNNEQLLHAKVGVVDNVSKHPGRGPSDACGMAHNPLGEDCKSSSSPNVMSDSRSPLEMKEVETPIETFNLNTLASTRRSPSSRRRQRCRMVTARRLASTLTAELSSHDNTKRFIHS